MNPKEREDFLKQPRLDPFGGQKRKRIEIAKRWGDEHDAMAVEPLWGAVCNPKEAPDLRLASLEGIGMIGGEVALAHLAAILNNAAEEILHDTAITALAHHASAPAVTALIEAWEHVNALDAEGIRRALASMDRAVTTRPLIAALGHSSEQVCAQAMKMLQQDSGRVPLLIEALKDKDAWQGVVPVLVKLGEPVVGPLIQVLEGEDHDRAEIAGQALTQIGPPAVRPLLTACMTQPEYVTWLVAMKPAIQTTFANASQGDLPLLQYLLKAPDAGLQEIAVQALPKAGEPALAYLLQIGAGDDARLAKVAQEALGTMGADAVHGLVDALRNPDERLRRSAAEALLKIEDPLAKALQPTLETWRSMPEAPKPLVVAPGRSGDFRTLSEAIANAVPGTIILLSDATHAVSGSIEINKPLTVLSDKAHLVGGKNGGVHVKGSCSLINVAFAHLPVTVSSTQARIYKCHFSEAGVGLKAKTQCEIAECEFVDGAVITVDGEATPMIQKNRLKGKSGHGISFRGGSGTVRQNMLEGFNIGIGVLGESTEPLLEANECSHCEWGITYNLTGKMGGIAIKNQCNHGAVGINVLGSSRVILRENQCSNNTGAGITAEQMSEVTIERNICCGNQTGIAITTIFSSCTAQDNRCLDNKGSGIVVSHAENVEVRGNTCTGNGQGIAVAGNAGNVVRLIANRCQNNKVHGIHISEESKCQVQNNDCSGNNEHGVLTMDQAAPILEGNVCRNNDIGIRYADQSGGTARSNHCESNRMSGIQVGDYAHPTVESNICRQNDMVGIIVAETAKPTLRNNECSSNTKGNVVRL